MLVRGPLPQIVRRDVDESCIARSSQNPTINRVAKKLGKDRNDIEAQPGLLCLTGLQDFDKMKSCQIMFILSK